MSADANEIEFLGDAPRAVPGPRLRWPAFVLAFVAALPPAIVLAVSVWRYAVDVPFFDEWGLAGLIQKSLRGTLHFSDLFAQHNVHRLFFPRLILLTTARSSGWDTRYELAVNFVLGCAIAAVFALRIAVTAREFRSRSYLFLIPVSSLMILSLSQYGNWMWGWQNQIFLVVLASASAIFALTGHQLRFGHLCLAIAAALVASFSFANGLLIWPLGLLALVFPNLRNARTHGVFIGLWVVVAIGVFAVYFYHFTMPSREGNAEGWRAPLKFAEYFFAYLGGPFSMFKLGVGVTVGALGLVFSIALAAYLVIARPVHARIYLPGALLWLFGLGSSLMTVFGRADFGTNQALASRYITISNLLWLGTIMMFAGMCYGPGAEGARPGRVARWSRAAFPVLVIAAGVATIRFDMVSLESFREMSHLEKVLRYKALQGIDDDQMRLLYPDPKGRAFWINTTRINHLWAWRPGAPASMFESPPSHYRTDGSDPESQFQRGLKYFRGDGESPDYKKALGAWTNAAEQGHGPAQYNLGQMYANGIGVAQDRGKAVEWYAKAAASGVADAQFSLGSMYAKGESVPQEFSTAFELWSKAAEQGHARAQHNLGLMYATGTGAAMDSAKAVEWYEKAADQGLAAGQVALGDAYAAGSGVARDDAKAFMWFDIAATQSYSGAAEKRDEVRAWLTPEQMNGAQRDSRRWTDAHKNR